MFQTPASQIGLVIMAAVCLFVGWAGGRAQKVAAAVVFAGWIASAAAEDRTFRNPQFLTMALDVGLTVIFVTLALIWRPLWLTALAVFQVLTMATHFAMILDPRIWPRASITAYMIWSYLVLASLGWGGVAGLLERRRAAPAP
ncbi:MAG: hypothetical protein K9G59_12835 [Caulobacter sp.]|nr:hypothetical protein [Caulobacter sp.]